jgi:hypothetical protein
MIKYLIPVLLLTGACTTNSAPADTETATKHKAPATGTIVAADSMDIVEDKLNGHIFSVSVIATDSSINGTYDVEAIWGNNLANSTIRLPHGGEHFRPLLRKGDSAYTYILGFHFDTDTIFHDYYQISAARGQIMMKYIKAYQ